MNVKTLTNVIKNETAAFPELSYFENKILKLALAAIGADHGGEASFIEIRHRLHLIGVTESELGVYDEDIKRALLGLVRGYYLRPTLTGYRIGPTLTTNSYIIKNGLFVIDTEEQPKDVVQP